MIGGEITINNASIDLGHYRRAMQEELEGGSLPAVGLPHSSWAGHPRNLRCLDRALFAYRHYFSALLLTHALSSAPSPRFLLSTVELTPHTLLFL